MSSMTLHKSMNVPSPTAVTSTTTTHVLSTIYVNATVTLAATGQTPQRRAESTITASADAELRNQDLMNVTLLCASMPGAPDSCAWYHPSTTVLPGDIADGARFCLIHSQNPNVNPVCGSYFTLIATEHIEVAIGEFYGHPQCYPSTNNHVDANGFPQRAGPANVVAKRTDTVYLEYVTASTSSSNGPAATVIESGTVVIYYTQPYSTVTSTYNLAFGAAPYT